ncbi:MAG: hypothetical protein ACLQG3_03020 [Terracidiphilus sp.]
MIACSLPAMLRLPRKAFWSIYAGCSCLVLLIAPAWSHGQLGVSLSYFNVPVFAAVPTALVALALLFLIRRRGSARHRPELPTASSPDQSSSWSSIFWLLGPASLGYLVLLLPPRESTFAVWDRYLLPVAPIAIVCLLKTYQDRSRGGIPKVAFFFLILVAGIGLAKTNRLHSESRAILKAANMLRADNVPRTQIAAGFEYDGETQLDAVGHMNIPDIARTPDAYHPYVPPPWLPSGFWYLSFAPAIVPRYFIVEEPGDDLAASKYPPAEYTTAIPPFHRFIYIQQVPGR